LDDGLVIDFSFFPYFSNIFCYVNLNILGLCKAFWYTGSSFTRYFYYNKVVVLRAQLYQLFSESEASIMLHCQLGSTHYTALWIKSFSKSISVIKVATMKYMGNFCFAKKAIKCYHQIDPLLLSTKMNGTQRRTIVSA